MTFLHLEETTLQLAQVVEVRWKGDRCTLITINGEPYETSADIDLPGFIRWGDTALNPEKIVSIEWHPTYANILDVRGILFEVKGEEYDAIAQQCGKVNPCPILEPVAEESAIAPLLLNINTCTQTDLTDLPGIGVSTAKKIIKARPIASIEELQAIAPTLAVLEVSDRLAF